MFSIVVAVSLNGVIGNEGQIPWRLPSDMKRFKELTAGGIVIMGRKTYQSLPPKFRPLPDRINIVLSRSMLWLVTEEGSLGCRAWSEVKDLVATIGRIFVVDNKVFVIGGQAVYETALPDADTIYRTVVQVECPGDTFFPEINLNEWELVEAEPMTKGEKDQYSSIFETWRRR